MNTWSPFSFLQSITSRLGPPAWLVEEGQQRLVLFLNHVLMQEKQAQSRLMRHKGQLLHLRWGVFALDLRITPAGLFDRAPVSSPPDLLVAVATESAWIIAQSVLAGKSPPVKIEGDVQLASQLGWLLENLRWDVEEDLSRLLGDIPAHAMVDAARKIRAGLQQFLAARSAPSATAPAQPAAAPASAFEDGKASA